MGKKLATIGHILYDVRCYVDDFPLPDRTSFTKGRIKYGAGGSACNVAVAARRLGVDAALIGRIGFDDDGRVVINRLLDEKVNVSSVSISYTESTGISVIIIDKEGTPEVVEMLGANEPLTGEEIRDDFLKGATWLHMTGTNYEALDYASQIAHEKKIPISFDPGRAMSRRGYKGLLPILNRIDYLTVNRKEAAQLAGTKAENDPKKMIDVIESGVDNQINFIIKGGKNPIYVHAPSCHFTLEPVNVDVVDTLGAGDSFVGGLVASLIKGNNLEESVKRAACVAALKVQREGAQSAPTEKEFAPFYKKMKSALVVNYL